jgi:thiol:disulfide interchange protein
MNRNIKRVLPVLAIAGLVGLAMPSLRPGNASAQQQEVQQEKPQVYDESADAREDIAAALARAKKENRRVLIQWGANWCGWCIKLHGLYNTDREIGRKLLYEYDLVLVDIGQWDKNLDLVEKYGADIKGQGVPYLTVLAADGTVVINHDTGSLEEGDHHDPAKVLGFLTENQADYLNAEDVLKAGLAEAKQTGRRVFLHFGAPWCGWCKRMERWLAREKVAEIWAKDFVDIKIDQDRMIGGPEIKERFPASTTSGIPWFAVLNADGSVQHDSMIMPDGGNVGCPWSFEELTVFAGLLKKAAVNITAAEQKLLLEEMLNNRIEVETERYR